MGARRILHAHVGGNDHQHASHRRPPSMAHQGGLIEQQTSNGVDRDVAEQDAPVIHQLVRPGMEKFMTMTECGGQPHPIQTIHT
jgi:hypothetical protein